MSQNDACIYKYTSRMLRNTSINNFLLYWTRAWTEKGVWNLHAIVNTEDISIPYTETLLNIETLSIAHAYGIISWREEECSSTDVSKPSNSTEIHFGWPFEDLFQVYCIFFWRRTVFSKTRATLTLVFRALKRSVPLQNWVYAVFTHVAWTWGRIL